MAVRGNEYNALNYERVAFFVKKGEREKIRQAAASAGTSVNEYIRAALAAYDKKEG